MRIHFIAIGGSAMHSLAIALHSKGYTISGSDDAIFEPSYSQLAAKGLLPNELGWFPEKIHSGLDAVILGMHAKKDNPELLKAQEIGVPIYSYPEFLFEQSKDKTRVVIAGSHGKTTITAMILHVLKFHDKAIDFMVGANVEGYDNSVQLTSTNDFILLEGDEYLSSPIDLRSKFLYYQPQIALISGIAWDHINVFPKYEDYLETFKKFIEQIHDGGTLTYNAEDSEVVRLVEQHPKYLKKFPYQTPSFQLKDGKTILDTPFGEVPLEIFGKHNLLNLEGARWICQQMGIQAEEFYEAIMSFKGAARRLEKIKENSDYTIFKDFAHAPSKVKATCAAVKEQFPDRKLIACLELHTYSSLQPEFLHLYQHSLDSVDEAIVFYSEEALRIKEKQPLPFELIQQAFKKDNLKVFTAREPLENFLKNLDKKNSILLMMSSGNYDGLELNSL